MSFNNVFNGLYKPPSASEEPTVKLVDWMIFEVGVYRHLAGREAKFFDGRVSSPITSYEGSKFTTYSGRVYELFGPSGMKGNASYVFNCWMSKYNLTDCTDVSKEYKIQP